MIMQFIRFDKNKIVMLNSNKSELTINQKGKQITIRQDEVDRVELHEQISIGKLETYNYLVLFILNGEAVVITEFTVPRLSDDNMLRSFLKGKPKAIVRKYFNYIDEAKFHPWSTLPH